jgi:hypothetical protein
MATGQERTVASARRSRRARVAERSAQPNPTTAAEPTPIQSALLPLSLAGFAYALLRLTIFS